MRVEVEFAVVAPKVVAVNGKVPPVSVPQESTPEVLDFTSQSAEFRPETMRLVEEAVPDTVIAVELAYGRMEATDEVATK